MIVAVAAVGASAGEASAQSFFESLFGLGSPHPPAGQPIQRLGTPGATGLADDDGSRGRGRSSARSGDDDDRANSGAKYQTMCVRTCDGYYWPVHYPVTRRAFKADADICTASCGAQAKLYYRPGPGTDAEEMTDLDGNSYGASATAFAYRKGLVNGCACRPMPWSEGERARHEGYALAEAEKALRVAEALSANAKAAAFALTATSGPPALALASQAEPEIAKLTGGIDPLSIGPAEAAALAAARDPGGADQIAPPQPDAKPTQRRASKREFAAVPERAVRSKRLTERPVRVAAAQPKPAVSWFGAPKFRYPGD